MEILALVSLHLQFFGPNYDIFAKTGRVSPSLEFLVSLVLDKIGNLFCASNLVGLEEKLGFVFFMKNVLICLTFPIV